MAHQRGARDPITVAGDREGGRGVYQVWHDAGWPERATLNARFGVETPFPGGFIHVADVQAASLGQAVALTTDAGDILKPDGAVPWQPWERKEGVRALVPRPYTRDTDAGDVIVDPRGQAHRYDGIGFRAIKAMARQSLPSPGAIAAECGRSAIIRGVDDVLEKRPDLDPFITVWARSMLPPEDGPARDLHPSPGAIAEDRDNPEVPGPERGHERGR